MTFQKTVRFDQAGGIPGEKANDGPSRAEPGILTAIGTVGRFFSEDPAKPGHWTQGAVSGSLRFALLTTPKQYAAQGTTAGGTLAPTMQLLANTTAEFATMGQFWVVGDSPNAMPGHDVYFSDLTGAIITSPPSVPITSGATKVAGAVVAPFPGGGNNQAQGGNMIVITLNGPLPYVAPAP
ncbi:MAG: hypothetical protein [Bacteriophage sp.]|nr:MAG: hypothetical protein [Bacteriophage sp.]